MNFFKQDPVKIKLINLVKYSTLDCTKDLRLSTRSLLTIDSKLNLYLTINVN